MTRTPFLQQTDCGAIGKQIEDGVRLMGRVAISQAHPMAHPSRGNTTYPNSIRLTLSH